MGSLTRQKANLAEVRQRELEAYVQVKKSVETVEQAQLEKAEVISHLKHYYKLKTGLSSLASLVLVFRE